MAVHGVNLGNWLVLEKWMKPDLFEGTRAEDEVWMSRNLSPEGLEKKLSKHRDRYVTEEDFQYLSSIGVNTVRLPVTYGVFGDRPPLLGAIDYVDLAMDWAEKYQMQILLDLHTVPGSQNGYDNGGLTGVCKWCKDPEEVNFALSVLERLAERYGTRPGLYGIEVLNEPISWLVYRTAPSTGKAADPEEAKGSSYVPLPFLRRFYREAYAKIRKYASDDKVVVFHDGFRTGRWKRFIKGAAFRNVMLDTHIYIFAMESFVPLHRPFVYRLFVHHNQRVIRRVQKYVPVLVGEWCISNRYATGVMKKADQRQQTEEALREEQTRRFRDVARMQLDAWNEAEGWFYWNYQLARERTKPMDEDWKESWDFCRCMKHGWLVPEDMQ